MITQLKSKIDSLEKDMKELKDENQALGKEMIRHATLRSSEHDKKHTSGEAFFFEDFNSDEIEGF